MKPAPEPVIVLSGKDLRPQGFLRPCPATTLAVLAVDAPTRVRCGELEGHAGPHVFHIEWTDAPTTAEEAS